MRYILARIVGLFLLLILASAVFLQAPPVQTAITQAVTGSLTGKIDGNVSIGAIKILPFNAIIIKDLLITDNHPFVSAGSLRHGPDTLISVGLAGLSISVSGVTQNEGIRLGSVRIRDVNFNLVTEPDTTYRNNLARVMGMKKKKVTDERNLGNLFYIKRLNADNLRFTLNNKTGKAANKKAGIDFTDMDATASLVASNISFAGASIYGQINSLTANEKTGYKINRLSCKFGIGLGDARIWKLHLVDKWSDIRMNCLDFSFESAQSWNKFCDEVTIKAELIKSRLCIRSLTEFCGTLGSNPGIFDISGGIVEGPVANLRVANLIFAEEKSGLTGKVHCHLKGLPDAPNTKIAAQVAEAEGTTSNISKFINMWSPNARTDLSSLATGQRIKIGAICLGTLNRMRIQAMVDGGFGAASSKLDLDNIIVKRRPLSVDGSFKAEKLCLKTVLGIDALGTCDASGDMLYTTVAGERYIKLDSVKVARIALLGKELERLVVNGGQEQGKWHFDLSSFDSGLRMDAGLDMTGSAGESVKQLSARIERFTPQKFGFGDFGTLSMLFDAGLEGNSGLYPASLQIKGLTITNEDGKSQLGNIYVQSSQENGDYGITFDSDFASAAYHGGMPLSKAMRRSLGACIGRSLPAVLPKAQEDLTDSTEAHLVLQVKSCKKLLDNFKKKLYVADGTSMSMDLSKDGKFGAELNSNRLAKGRDNLKEVKLSLSSADSTAHFNLHSEEFTLSNICLHDFNIESRAGSNKLTSTLDFKGADVKEKTGDMRFDCVFDRTEATGLRVSILPEPSHFKIGRDYWTLSNSEVKYRKGSIEFEDLTLRSGNQTIRIDGGADKESADTLNMDFTNLDLSLADMLLKKPLGTNGELEGHATLISPLSTNPGLLAVLRCDSLKVADSEVNNISIRSVWDDANKRIAFRVTDNVRDRTAMETKGYYNPVTHDMSADLSLDRFNLELASPFSQGSLNDLRGNVSGRVSMKKTSGKNEIKSEGLRLDKASFRLEYTGAAYTISGPISLSNGNILLDGLDIQDEYDGSASINGEFKLAKNNTGRLEGTAIFDNLRVIDLRANSKKPLYGMLNVSGKASVSGPVNKLSINARIETSGPGNIHIPLNTSQSATSGGILSFKQVEIEADPYEETFKSAEVAKAVSEKVNLHATIKLGEEVSTNIEIDKDSGHYLTANAKGNITLDINSSKPDMDLDGDISISRGVYHFLLPGIARDFNIESGSTIILGGGLPETKLDINAVYNVKTSLTTLLADTTSAAMRRNVECGIHITDKLSNPSISFSIKMPELDPTTKASVDVALNTEDKVQKQFMALLLFGSFIPSEQSGVINGSNLLYSNVNAIMSSQINNIFEKLNIPVDLGFGYQQNTRGADIFDVAVSTELFNNRVLVNGSVGSKKYSNNINTSDVVGDLDIEIKLDKPGLLRLKLFSHSADQYSGYLDNTQRNGFGLTYQKEFDRFLTLLKEMFTPKSKLEKPDPNAVKPTKTITVK